LELRPRRRASLRAVVVVSPHQRDIRAGNLPSMSTAGSLLSPAASGRPIRRAASTASGGRDCSRPRGPGDGD